jgi:hypothetical protein
MVSYLPDIFYHWLSGFIAAEGCFILWHNPKRIDFKFSLTQRADRIFILERIQEWTGIGQINLIQRATPEVVWNVSSRSDCLNLIRILDGHPLRAKKSDDYRVWRQAVMDDRYRQSDAFEDLKLLHQYRPQLRYVPNTDPGFNYWLGGLIEGKGCFGINRTRSRGKPQGYGCNFQLRLREDDTSILETVTTLTKLGTCRPCKANSTSNPGAVWSFWGKDSANELNEMIQSNKIVLFGPKKFDFILWNEALQIWNTNNGLHHAKDQIFDWSEMANLKLELNKSRFTEKLADLKMCHNSTNAHDT